MRYTLFAVVFLMLAFKASAQSIDKFVGSYITVDSAASSYMKDGKWYKDADTTLLVLNKDMTFSYKWSPMFGRYANGHIITTGTWSLKENNVVLNSKYQQDEYRFFESYKPEYGDSLVKVYVQTYDSFSDFFDYQFIAVMKDTVKKSQMIFPDTNHSSNGCGTTFQLRNVDKIVFYGDFGRMPPIIPKDKKSNHFILQYNLSDNWDYQYFKDFKVKMKDNKAIMGSDEDMKIELTKM